MDVKTSIFLVSKIMYNTIQGSGSMKHKILIITIMWILYGTLEEYIPILSHDLVAWIPIIITLCLIFDVYPKSLFSKTYKLEKKITKNNTTMCFVEIEDIGASIECIVFSKLYADRVMQLQAGNVIVINGRLSLREEKEPTVICETIEPNPYNVLKSELGKKKQRKGLFLRFESRHIPLVDKIDKVFEGNDGNMNLYYYYMDTKKYEFKKSVSLSGTTTDFLIELLGEENVVVRE